MLLVYETWSHVNQWSRELCIAYPRTHNLSLAHFPKFLQRFKGWQFWFDVDSDFVSGGTIKSVSDDGGKSEVNGHTEKVNFFLFNIWIYIWNLYVLHTFYSVKFSQYIWVKNKYKVWGAQGFMFSSNLLFVAGRQKGEQRARNVKRGKSEIVKIISVCMNLCWDFENWILLEPNENF